MAIETARGRAVQNFNLGNISAGASYPGTVWRPPWFEPEPGERNAALHEKMKAGEAPSAFRAYDSAEAGARDLARLLSLPRYENVMQAADSTDPNAFREALSKDYSHDYASAKHTASFASLMKEFGLAPAVAGGLFFTAFLVWALWRASRG